MEDRIHAAGNGDELVKAIKKFKSSRKNGADQGAFYDALTNLGATPEEADDYINLFFEI